MATIFNILFLAAMAEVFLSVNAVDYCSISCKGSIHTMCKYKVSTSVSIYTFILRVIWFSYTMNISTSHPYSHQYRDQHVIKYTKKVWPMLRRTLLWENTMNWDKELRPVTRTEADLVRSHQQLACRIW